MTSPGTHSDTWDEPVEVEVEGLQRRGAPRAAINRQHDPALGQAAGPGVQLHAWWVLDAAEMAPLRTPDVLDAESV